MARNIGAAIFCLLILLSFVAHPIHMTTADLGEEITTGQYILEHGHLSTSNIFSYTAPNYPYIDHHWASEVFLYLTYHYQGFNGLSIFFLIITSVTFLIAFFAAMMVGNINTALLASILTIPLISSRIEIRPELFSNLFAVIFLSVLVLTSKKLINKKYLFILPFVQILWVNFQIYFFLGPVLLTIFLLTELFTSHSDRSFLKTLSLATLFAVIACLINPHFILGAIMPLIIYRNYSLKVIEEQPVWIIEKYLKYVPLSFYKLTVIVLLLTLISRFKKFWNVFLLTIFTILFGAIMMRNFVIFGYFSLILISLNIKYLWKKFPKIAVAIPYQILLTFLIIIFIGRNYWTNAIEIGFGVPKQEKEAANFFISNHLKGPIFNNYDIGSYLVFFLYPKEKVFVDNYPNKYPNDFFTKIYIPMKEDEKKWQELDKKYGFNCIFLYLLASDDSLKGFIERRINDPAWAVVYLDDERIIFLRNNQKNSEIIKKYKINL